MSMYINSELMDVDDQEVCTGNPETTDDSQIIDSSCTGNKVTFDWQDHRQMSGRERYLALCNKLGLKPKEIGTRKYK